ncbi:MAG TPA: 2Fe-2S iron-sulfur cluster-binding protein [Bradyrhizobium sp.]
MTAIVFIHPDGRREHIDAKVAESAMLAATSQGVAGILAECGGNAMCATCHVYVEAGWLDRLPVMTSEEDALLEGAAAERRPNSRLSCQIKMTPELEGLELRLPDRQT